ncbi:hypothetical protein [Schlesneria paludicola]|uniref:hypothetical protein n=1 Tax=Schlesneria paludicola TaxID=360056 RepID=UPI00029ADF98|nr:hypothetical protein [Schlesneria paludicola]
MAVQFAGSSSTGNRRRRRLAANGDVAGVDTPQVDGEGTQFESQLVASEAACPWVPVSEARIWIYSAALMVFLAVLAFATIRSDLFPAQLSPLTATLFSGESPAAVTQTQFVLLGLAAQLAALITWYRARCMLDFAGRYRVWPWAVGLCAIAAFCQATGTHRAIGAIVAQAALIPWRGHTVAWLLPLCVISLPLTLFLDRDTRKNPSSVWMLRISESLWLLEACLELYQPELRGQLWYASTYLLVPLFASAALFVGLWQHARLVAYICPDPPVLDEQSAWSLGLSVCRWLGRRFVLWKRTSTGADAEDDDEDKPKRRRKKATTDEAAATKKKRKPAAKRASTARTRTRVKSADEEDAVDDAGEVAEEQDLTSADETEQAASDESTSWEEAEEQWEEEAVEEPPEPPAPPSKSKGSNRVTQVHQPHSAPAPHARWQAEPEEEEAPVQEEPASSSYSDSNDEEEDDGQSYQGDTELTAEQMRGLSKRQKRDLKKQLRDQERSRKR